MSDKLRRANVSETVKMSLLSDIHGSCPLCRNKLIVKNNNKDVRVFDVAHIYPLHATEREIEILKDEVRLSDDIDCEENFIVLCKICHKIYDTKKTAEEYRQLVKIKQELNKVKKLSVMWNNQTLHKDILIVSNKIGSLKPEDVKLSYKALTLSEKKNDTFSFINEMKVEAYIVNFYVPIKEALKDLERLEKAKSKVICSQVKSYYTFLEMNDFNQDQIFEKMTEWFMTNTGIFERPKAEVLVSYFIQNCEVYS